MQAKGWVLVLVKLVKLFLLTNDLVLFLVYLSNNFWKQMVWCLCWCYGDIFVGVIKTVILKSNGLVLVLVLVLVLMLVLLRTKNC